MLGEKGSVPKVNILLEEFSTSKPSPTVVFGWLGVESESVEVSPVDAPVVADKPGAAVGAAPKEAAKSNASVADRCKGPGSKNEEVPDTSGTPERVGEWSDIKGSSRAVPKVGRPVAGNADADVVAGVEVALAPD